MTLSITNSLLITIFGLLIGSFLNVVIVRLPKMILFSDTKNLFFPRSHCVSCEKPLAIYDNIPIMSFLYLKGQCRYCKTPISYRYPIVEFITALLSFIVVFSFGFNGTAFAALLLTWVLIALTFIDLEHTLLPDSLTIPCLWFGLFLNYFHVIQPLQSCVLGAILGYLSLWSVYWIFKLLTGKEGMGYGDFKLLAMLGAWLGWQALLPIILLSSLTGAIYGMSLILFKHGNKNTMIPFGPFLSMGGFITMLYENDIIQFYFKVMNI